MNPTRYALTAMRAMVYVLWLTVGVATAATVVIVPHGDLDPWIFLWASMVSTLAGGTALANRVNNFLLRTNEDGSPAKLVRPWLFAIAHMSGSWSAGTLGFLVARAQAWDVTYLLMCVLLFSFGGAKVLEAGAEKWLPVVPVSRV